MSGEKTGTWTLADAGNTTAMSWDAASNEYQQKSEALRQRLVELASKHIGLAVEHTAPDPAGDPPVTGADLVKALNNVQSLHNERHFEARRVESAVEQLRRFAEL